ncbi:unnamed protein product [Strongylus vulgaris]|uniref:Uncharacterized protein n=1 Tax=Strongylus vulgaris TaxID=40348 RepID=A0A3P7KGV4_STRVU|nr:unnamed protein product [Strongylus vulgaris]
MKLLQPKPRSAEVLRKSEGSKEHSKESTIQKNIPGCRKNNEESPVSPSKAKIVYKIPKQYVIAAPKKGATSLMPPMKPPIRPTQRTPKEKEAVLRPKLSNKMGSIEGEGKPKREESTPGQAEDRRKDSPGAATNGPSSAEPTARNGGDEKEENGD